MDRIQMELFEQLTGLHEIPAGAYNIRANSQKDSRNTTENIDIVTKDDKDGIDIYVKPEESVAYYTVNGQGSDEFKIEL